MLIHRSYKIPLKLNNKEKFVFTKHAGVARFAWNWGLALCKEKLDRKELVPNDYELSRILNSIKKEQFSWMYECSKAAPQKALEHLGKAFKRFFAKKSKFPKFKKKNRSIQSFDLISKSFKIEESRIKLPIIGWVRFLRKRHLPLSSKINSITCKFIQNRWFAIIQVEENLTIDKSTSDHIIGIDLGLKYLAVTSDGEVFENHKSTKKYEKKLARLNRSFSRKRKGSKNSQKFKLKLQKLHAKISNSRLDQIHKMTSSIVKTKPGKIVLEDLNVEGMKKNHCLAKAVSDASFGEIRRQLNYKSSWNGVELQIADRFFPSSKLCSRCGNKKTDLKLSERVYKCCSCNNEIDRDFNAALNLKLYGTGGLSGSIESKKLDSRKPVEKKTSVSLSRNKSCFNETGTRHEGIKDLQ